MDIPTSALTLPETDQRVLWVDLMAVRENLQTIRNHLQPETKVLAVLKALAYGTALVDVGLEISELGFDSIGVSSVREGIALRDAGVEQEILVFLPFTDCWEQLVEYRLTPVVYSLALLQNLISFCERESENLEIHLKVNTGMNRVGVDPKIVNSIVDLVKGCTFLEITGVCTHFASADDPAEDQFTQAQIEVFEKVLGQLRDQGVENINAHACNTAGSIRFRNAHFDMVRVGLGLYGIHPSEACREELPLKLALAMTSKIDGIDAVPSGSFIGYGSTYVTKKDSRIATVPFGFEDGMPRHRSNRAYVLVDGKRAPVVGRVSMDQMRIDITDIPSAAIGSQVLLYGEIENHTITPEELSEWSDTIPHELLTRIGTRVKRVYLSQAGVDIHHTIR